MIDWTASPERSMVPLMMSRPAASDAGIAEPVAMSAFSENTASMSGSASSLAWISASLFAGRPDPAESCRFSTLPNVSAAPSQRCCRPMLLASWIGQRILVAPSSLNFRPACWPAMNSSWPTWVKACSFRKSAEPEFMVTSGIPASLALSMAPWMASGLGAETAMPSHPASTPASMNWACASGSLFDSW